MVETKQRPKVAARVVRIFVLLAIVGAVGYALWRQSHRSEGYTGGDVVTTGTVDAVHVRLGFKVPGRLADVPVVEGAEVVTGQLLGRLDSQDLEVQVASAAAALATARANVSQALAGRTRAARDLARQRELMAGEATTAQALDAARASAGVAQAQVEAAQAQVRQAQSAQAQAKLQLSYVELRAPQAGQVEEKIHRPGEMVMLGTPVVTLAELDTVKVLAPVDETRVGAVRAGDPADVRVYTFDRKVFSGRVSDIQAEGEFATRKDWGAQRRDIRTFTVTVRVPNPQHLLKDGMTAEVRIRVDSTLAGSAETPR